MRSDHLAKHIKTHENKAKKLMAKKGDKSEKASKNSPLTTSAPTIIKQEKVDEEDIKPSMFPVDSSSTNYIDTNKSGSSFIDPSTLGSQSTSSQLKPSIEDYYQSYHPYQYQYGSNYFHHQNSRFYQDKNYFYGHVMGSEQNRGIFSSPPAASTAPQSNNLIPTQAMTNSVQNQQQNGFYQQTPNYSNGNSTHTSNDQNYLLNFNASINNTININTSNLMININNSTTNTLTNNTYHSQHTQQQ